MESKLRRHKIPAGNVHFDYYMPVNMLPTLLE